MRHHQVVQRFARTDLAPGQLGGLLEPAWQAIADVVATDSKTGVRFVAARARGLPVCRDVRRQGAVKAAAPTVILNESPGRNLESTAEDVGFEPTVTSPPLWFSRPTPSAARQILLAGRPATGSLSQLTRQGVR